MEVASFSPLPVGVLLWNGPEPSLTVITKMTLTFGPAGFAMAEVQQPLHGPRASRFGCPLELDHPGDFVPRKASCDVLLTGNAHADAPSLVIGVNVRIGSIRKRFYALASARSEAIPLSVAYLRAGPDANSTEVTVGPVSEHHPEREPFARLRVGSPAALRREVLSAQFDFGYFNRAPEDQRLTTVAPGMEVRLHGLAPGGAAIHGHLPTRWPRIHVPDERSGRGLREVGLECDTLWIDTDRAVCELTFRGTLVLHRGVLPARLISTLGEAFENVDVARIEARVAFARPLRATEPEDVAEPSEPLRQAFSLAQAETSIEVLEEVEPELEVEPERGAPMEPARMEPVRMEPAPPAAVRPSPFEALVAAGLSPASAAFFASTASAGSGAMRQAETVLLPPEPASEPASVPKIDFRRTVLHAPAPSAKADPDRTMLHTPTASAKADPDRTMLHTLTASAKADPDRTMLHTALPVRPQTLPFAGGARPSPASPPAVPPESGLPFATPRVSPPESGLPFMAPRVPPPQSGAPLLVPRGPQTMELSPEANPVLAATPFPDRPFRRGRTLDLTPGTEVRAPLPFAGGDASAPLPGSPKHDVGAGLPFAARPPAPPVPSAAPVFGLPPAVVAPAATPPARVPPAVVSPAAMPPAMVPPAVPSPAAMPPAMVPLAHEEAEPRTLVPPPPAGAESVADTLPPTAGAESAEPITLVPPAPRRADISARDTLPPAAALLQIPFGDEAAAARAGTPYAASLRAPALPGGMGTPEPMGPPPPMVGPSDPTVTPPWAAGLGPARGAGRMDALSGSGPRESKLGLFSLERDAEIQLALWRGTAPLHETLAAHGTDELTWREHRRLRDAALREEAETGGNARAIAVHEAIERARHGAPPPVLPSLDLAAYAEVRVVLRDADDETAALAARGIDLARWQQDHRHYRRRLLKDPAFAEQLRAAIEAKASPAASSVATAGPPRSATARPSRKGHESPHEDAGRTAAKSRARVRKMGGSRAPHGR